MPATTTTTSSSPFPEEDLVEQQLKALTDSVTAALTSLPSPSPSSSSPSSPSSSAAAGIAPPKNGISLLDVKNELLLSYLHNIVHLALVRLKHGSIAASPAIADLVKLRLLLERGVRPLEAKIKYQVDKVVLAAVSAKASTADRRGRGAEGEEEDSSGSASEGDQDEDDDDDDDGKDTAKAELAFRPNPSSLLLSGRSATTTATTAATNATNAAKGVYKPPRIAATSMPVDPATTSAGTARERIRQKAGVVEEFVAEELSSAPIAVPSIGTTIAGSAGRNGYKTRRERQDELERQEFEEANLVRLPKSSKKGRTRGSAARGGGDAYGGEDWRSFAGDLDRLTRVSDRGGGNRGVLERSRNNKRRSGDGDGDGGVGIGKHYEGRKGILGNKRQRRG